MSKISAKPTNKPHGKIISSQEIKIALKIFLLAALVRAVYLYDSSDNPTFSIPIVDSLTYDQMAKGLAETGSLTHEFFWQPPFYPLFLALIYKLSYSSILTVKIIQALLGSLTSVLAYFLGKKLFDKSVGVLSGVFVALYMPLVFYDGELLAAGWSALWAVTLILALVKTSEKPNLYLSFAMGLFAALSIITRPEFLPFSAAAFIWLLLVWVRRHTNPKKIVLCLALLLVGFSSIAAPVAFLSSRIAGKASFLPLSGGINLYIGNNPDYKKTINIRPGLAWEKLTKLPAEHGAKNSFEDEKFFSDKVRDYIRTQPASFLKGLFYKSAQFLSSRETPRNLDIYLFRKWSPLLKIGLWKSGRFGFPFGLLLPLAVVGLIFNWRKVPAPVWLFLILYPASIILVFVASRYRVPAIPLMAVLAAAGCSAIWRLFKFRNWAKLTPVLVIIITIAISSSLAGPFYAEQLDYEPELYYGVGDSLNKYGRPAEAINAYSTAVSLRNDFIEVHQNLALLLVKQGMLDDAVEHYRTALKFDPNNASLYEGLGEALFKQGKVNDAIELYRKAIEIKPDSATAYDKLGTAFFFQKRIPEAMQYYSKSIELDPNDSASQNNIGNAFILQGQLSQAVEHYEKSLSLKEDAETLNNMANALADLGRLQEAAVKYDRALLIAPENAGIYCNLAVCFEKQGKIDDAVTAYRKALSLDPQNNRAQKALERLSKPKPLNP
ncbi:MAG: tetratricopeptide repeat protein [Phycisphaerae bacterium]|jgi:tetratricopeptide (TPR) repeat protein